MAEAEPTAVGLNRMVMVQLLFAASDVPQVLDWIENSLALVPVNLYELTVISWVPVLNTVSTWAGAVTPTLVEGNVRLLGEKLTVGRLVAVPLSGTDCGEPAALSVATRFAEAEPATVGLKPIVSVQLAPAAREVPQVFEAR